MIILSSQHFFPKKWAEPNFVSFNNFLPRLLFVSLCTFCAKPTGVTILTTQTMHYHKEKSSKNDHRFALFPPPPFNDPLPPNKQTDKPQLPALPSNQRGPVPLTNQQNPIRCLPPTQVFWLYRLHHLPLWYQHSTSRFGRCRRGGWVFHGGISIFKKKTHLASEMGFFCVNPSRC